VIALVQLDLASDLLILKDEELEALSYSTNAVLDGVGEVEVIVHPPYCSQRPGRAPEGTVAQSEALDPIVPQPVDPSIKVDGMAAVRCDAIAVDIIAPDFDRRVENALETQTQLLGLACEAVNAVLQRLRVLARAPHLKALDPDSPDSFLFRISFLDDSGVLLAPDEGKFRRIANSTLRLEHVAVTPATW
jgi:hypothetical protein